MNDIGQSVPLPNGLANVHEPPHPHPAASLPPPRLAECGEAIAPLLRPEPPA
jgi:hypothetical protein